MKVTTSGVRVQATNIQFSRELVPDVTSQPAETNIGLKDGGGSAAREKRLGTSFCVTQSQIPVKIWVENHQDTETRNLVKLRLK